MGKEMDLVLVFLKTWRLTLELDSDHTCDPPVVSSASGEAEKKTLRELNLLAQLVGCTEETIKADDTQQDIIRLNIFDTFRSTTSFGRPSTSSEAPPTSDGGKTSQRYETNLNQGFFCPLFRIPQTDKKSGYFELGNFQTEFYFQPFLVKTKLR